MKKLVLSLSGSGLLQRNCGICCDSAKHPHRYRSDPMRHLNQNSQGELVGFDIDLAKELCKRINTQCTFVETH